MRKTSFAVAAVLAFSGLAAAAENQAPTAETPARYAFNRVNDGFLRLDNVSGQIAFCSPTSAGWACQAVPEDRAALEKEIARLQDEVADLKRQVAALREPPPPRPPADLSGPSAQSERAAELRADLSRAKAAVQSAWQKLVDMISGLQKDVMRKS
jgi:cell division protein FtsB